MTYFANIYALKIGSELKALGWYLGIKFLFGQLPNYMYIVPNVNILNLDHFQISIPED